MIGLLLLFPVAPNEFSGNDLRKSAQHQRNTKEPDIHCVRDQGYAQFKHTNEDQCHADDQKGRGLRYFHAQDLLAQQNITLVYNGLVWRWEHDPLF